MPPPAFALTSAQKRWLITYYPLWHWANDGATDQKRSLRIYSVLNCLTLAFMFRENLPDRERIRGDVRAVSGVFPKEIAFLLAHLPRSSRASATGSSTTYRPSRGGMLKRGLGSWTPKRARAADHSCFTNSFPTLMYVRQKDSRFRSRCDNCQSDARNHVTATADPAFFPPSSCLSLSLSRRYGQL